MVPGGGWGGASDQRAKRKTLPRLHPVGLLPNSNLPLAQPLQEDANPFEDVLKHSINHLSYMSSHDVGLHYIQSAPPPTHTHIHTRVSIEFKSLCCIAVSVR